MVFAPEVAELLDTHQEILQILRLSKRCAFFLVEALSYLKPERVPKAQEAFIAVDGGLRAMVTALTKIEEGVNYILADGVGIMDYRAMLLKGRRLADQLHQSTKAALEDLLKDFDSPKTEWEESWK